MSNQNCANQNCMNPNSMNRSGMGQGCMNQGGMNRSSMNQGCMNQGSMNQGCGSGQRSGAWQQGHPGTSCQQPQMQTRGNAGSCQQQTGGACAQERQGNSSARMAQENRSGASCGCGAGSSPSRQQLMRRVTLSGFACVDASLYLDTHPEDAEALSYFREQNRIYREAVEEYSKTYGPLTIAHAHHCDTYWNWVNQPWPWQ